MLKNKHLRQRSNIKNILLIQTGGTIAMSAKGDGVALDPSAWSHPLIEKIPQLSELTIIHTIPFFFEDSSDLNHHHWIKLAECIHMHYHEYDGFVVIHGTDTMAFTASALSFALKYLTKPIVFTGSQVPLASIRSDARRNLINSIEIATSNLQEVVICFNDQVYRGNRTTKLSIGDFDAFGSPNLPPLATIGLEVKFCVETKKIIQPFSMESNFSNELIVLTVFPSLDINYLLNLDITKLKAIIVRSFGSGNIPTKGNYSVLPFLEKCTDHGVIVAMISQAYFDAIDLSKYVAGKKISQAGAISCRDMTLEASLTKMMWLLAQYNNKETIQSEFLKDMAGELTV